MTATLDLSLLPPPLRDEVTLHWTRLLDNAGHDIAWLIREPDVLTQIAKVWACSPFIAKHCSGEPARLQELVESGDLKRAYRADEFERRLSTIVTCAEEETQLMRGLRRFRSREIARIAWRDITGTACLRETTRDLSRLADASVHHCLPFLQRGLEQRYGTPRNSLAEPQSLIVLALGKLGADELNFSSDIDLIFAYPESGETTGTTRTLSNQEFFIHLGKRLIKALNDVTEDGFVFRVDMRLRPFGDSGPLVTSSGAMDEYYQVHGRDWERYAMIKGRVIAGDPVAGKELMTAVRPFVYRRYLDFGAIASIREMKQMVDDESTRRGLEDDIKLGPGGIREIEFIGQTFQLIWGGRQPALRTRPILTVLGELEKLELLPASTVQDLREAYIFLRTTEHRLQQVHDRQIQTLPESSVDRERLAFGMEFPDRETFAAALNEHRNRVAEHFSQLLGINPDQASVAKPSGAGALYAEPFDPGSLQKALETMGFDDPGHACETIIKLRESHAVRHLSRDARDRMDRLMPMLFQATADAENPSATLTRTLEIIEAVARRSVYLALLAENPQALAQLVRLCSASPWISGQITRQPILLDELLDPRQLYSPPDGDELSPLLAGPLSSVGDDPERRMEVLRQFKHAQVLRVAAADITGSLPLAEVSNHLSAIAETVIGEALSMAWKHLEDRHGQPTFSENGQRHTAGFAVVAYGKLGGLELSYSSDLDLIFLHNSRANAQETDGARPIDNDVFFSRLAQRVIHHLSTATPSGRCYETDTRLRPSGASGLLVSRLDAYEEYQQKQAWTWEHQALVRARAVAGDTETQRGFTAIRQRILASRHDPIELRSRIAEMRARMREDLCSTDRGVFDLKQGPGGITDIEFMVQYGVLRWAAEYPELIEVTDNLRLLERFAEKDLLGAEACEILHDAYFAYRADIHRLALQERPALVDDSEHRGHRKAVTAIWKQIIEKPNGDTK